MVKAENGIALKLDGPSDGKVVNKTEERVFETKPWHPDQLRSMQERCGRALVASCDWIDIAHRAEKHAREQKRQAEVHAASTSITTQETGALELADSVILFLFSFWTRGLRRHMERASRSGELESWLSTAAFAETTRKVARQHGRPFIPVVALLWVLSFCPRLC